MRKMFITEWILFPFFLAALNRCYSTKAAAAAEEEKAFMLVNDGENSKVGIQRVQGVISPLYSSEQNNHITERPHPTIPSFCKLPPEVGNCSRALPRFYFDASTNRCVKFTYSGCDGNANRFVTRRRCRHRCGSLPSSPVSAEHRKKARKRPRLKESTLRELQKLKEELKLGGRTPRKEEAEEKNPQKNVQRRNCTESDQCGTGSRCWNGECQCLNGFELDSKGDCADVDECEWNKPCVSENSHCVNLPGSFRCECASGFAGSGFNCSRDEMVCLQPFDSRYKWRCLASASGGGTDSGIQRFFYDPDSGVCRPFDYGGCQFGTSMNFFVNKKSCESVCRTFLRVDSDATVEAKPPLASAASAEKAGEQVKVPLPEAITTTTTLATIVVDDGGERQLDLLKKYEYSNDNNLETADRLQTAADVVEKGENGVGSKDEYLVTPLKEEPPPLPKFCLDPLDQSLLASCPSERSVWRRRYYFDRHTKSCRFFWHDTSCNNDKTTSPTDEIDSHRSGETPKNLFTTRRSCRRTCENLPDESSNNGTAGITAGVIQITLTNGLEKQNGRNGHHKKKKPNKTNKAFPTETAGDTGFHRKKILARPVLLSSSTPAAVASPRRSPQPPPIPESTSKRLSYRVEQPDGCHVDFFTEVFTQPDSAERRRVMDRERAKAEAHAKLRYEMVAAPTDVGLLKEAKQAAPSDHFRGRLAEHCLEHVDVRALMRACSRGRSWQYRWFYDAPAKVCRPFWYDDCPLNGLRNFFREFSECWDTCVMASDNVARSEKNEVSEEKKQPLGEFRASEYELPPPPPLPDHFGGGGGSTHKTPKERHYIDSGELMVDHTQCTGFRYSMSGQPLTKLLAYLCLMEEGGICQREPPFEPHSDGEEGEEQCYSSRSWLHGPHSYSWFFTLQPKPSSSQLSSINNNPLGVLNVFKVMGGNETMTIPLAPAEETEPGEGTSDDGNRAKSVETTVKVRVLTPTACTEICRKNT